VFTGDGGRCSVFAEDFNLSTADHHPERPDSAWTLHF
jgi:hypothetical protein